MIKTTSLWRYRRVHRTTLIAIFCASFLGGLGLVQAGLKITGIVWLCSAGLLLFCRKKRLLFSVPAVLIAGSVVGLWHGTAVRADLQTYQSYIGQKVTVTGTVIDDSTYGDKGQRDMRLRNVRLDGRSPPGVVRVTSLGLAQPRRGDEVQVTGKLYDGFGPYQAAIYFGDLKVLTTNNDPLERMRHQFAASIYSVMPDTQASLGLGVLVGIKTQLSDSLNDQLKALSLTHIVVASGYNLTVLVRLARRLFENRSKYQTAVVGGALMVGFVMITGFSASMSRAALVSGLSLAAWYYGRRIHPAVLLLFAAAITAAINPIYLWSDIGWWLSFLAFAGVLLLAPLLEHRIFGDKRPKLVGQLLIETVSAQIMTVPLMLGIFGNFSVLGLLANVLIVPLIPLAMLLTCVAGLVGFFAGSLAGYAALPATWLLTYVTQLVEWLARVPWASIPLQVSPLIMIGLYGLLAGFGLVLLYKTRHDFLARSVLE